MRDGKLIAAAHEERFTRKKHDQEFPSNAIAYCLKKGGITVDDLDYVGFYDKPFIKFERILLTYLATFPKGFASFRKALPLWLRKKLWIRQLIHNELEYDGPLLFSEHHQSHAASTFLFSPFEEAAILTVDGVGEWATATLGVGKGNEIDLHREIRFPHSLGLLYSAFTGYLGFKVNSAEYKVMGLAPYGKPIFYDKIMNDMVVLKEDGSFKLNMKYFAYDYGLSMFNKQFEEFFGHPSRRPESKLEQCHKDIAASVQKVTEEIVLRMVNHLHEETGQDNLCMAGGVALNCVANGRVIRETPFKKLFVQPAAGDAGGAVGVAAFIYHTLLGNPRNGNWSTAYLGPEYSDEEIGRYLKGEPVEFPVYPDAERYRLAHTIPYRVLEREELIQETARLIEDQKIIGWFQGRMEYGPRALGNRSIIADARNAENRDKVNLAIKFRESFRPFAPTVLEEYISEYFEIDRPSPYMLLVAQVREHKRTIPAVTHVDGSARIQSIHRDENPLYYDLIEAFRQRTGCPVIINTSFNVRGEPIVCSPDDAFMCFMRTHMDHLVMGSYLLSKTDMPPMQEAEDWRSRFVLD
jgi:carbamoyltransferase